MAYRRDLELWEKYFQTSRTDIPGFFEFMKKQGLSIRSQARVISSLRTYMKFCERNGQAQPELRDLRPPKVNAKLPRPITPDEFQKLFLSCVVVEKEKVIRNQLTLLFLYGLGCRVSEMVALDLKDFNPIERWVKVLGKGQKERLIPLSDTVVVALDNYMKNARPLLCKDNSQNILVNDRGHRPSRVDVWRWLAAWSKTAGFSEPVHPHRFRHGYATSLLESGADLRSIQMLLGHSSLQTTQVYTTVSTQTLKSVIDAKHPLSRPDIET